MDIKVDARVNVSAWTNGRMNGQKLASFHPFIHPFVHALTFTLASTLMCDKKRIRVKQFFLTSVLILSSLR